MKPRVGRHKWPRYSLSPLFLTSIYLPTFRRFTLTPTGAMFHWDGVVVASASVLLQVALANRVERNGLSDTRQKWPDTGSAEDDRDRI